MIHVSGAMTGFIANIGGTKEIGNYRFEIDGMKGRVEGFPRLDRNAHDLLYLCLQQLPITPDAKDPPNEFSVRLELWPYGFAEMRQILGSIRVQGEKYEILEKKGVWKKGSFTRSPGVALSVLSILQKALRGR